MSTYEYIYIINSHWHSIQLQYDIYIYLHLQHTGVTFIHISHPSHSCFTQGVGPKPIILCSQHLFSSTCREAFKLIRKSGGLEDHLSPKQQSIVGTIGKDRQATTDRHSQSIFNSLDVLKYDFEAPQRSWTAYLFFYLGALESSRKGTSFFIDWR